MKTFYITSTIELQAESKEKALELFNKADSYDDWNVSRYVHELVDNAQIEQAPCSDCEKLDCDCETLSQCCSATISNGLCSLCKEHA